MAKEKLFYLDFVRAVALISILIIHFNAAITGYFTYPSKLFGSVLPGGIYLGDFGSSLFFIVSGAALAYTTAENMQPLAFYQKRARAVYPMFWLAWAGCFGCRMILRPGYYDSAKTATLAFSAVGLDTFALSAGWVSHDFAGVGEWFLGSILFLYLLFPLLHFGLKKQPLLTWLAALAVCLPIHLFWLDSQLVCIHIIEFLFGMTFLHFYRKPKPLFMAGAFIWPLLCGIKAFMPVALDGKIFCALVSMGCFAALAGAGELLGRFAALRQICAILRRYSYPVFLMHHVIVLRMTEGYDLAVISRRDSALLFVVYLLATAAASWGLKRADEKIRAALGGFYRLCKAGKQAR